MIRYIFFIVCLLCLLFAEEENEELKMVTSVSSNGISNSLTWANKAHLKPDDFVTKLFKSLQDEYYIQNLDKVFEEVISEKNDPKKGSITIVKKIHFFVKPNIDYYPEALISFLVTIQDFDDTVLNDPQKKVIPTVTIKLDSPCKLYTNHFDFALDKFDIETIQLFVTAKSTGTHWTIQNSFTLKSLFLVSWLSSVKKTLKISQEPKVHPILLFFKQRFDEINDNLYNKLK